MLSFMYYSENVVMKISEKITALCCLSPVLQRSTWVVRPKGGKTMKPEKGRTKQKTVREREREREKERERESEREREREG